MARTHGTRSAYNAGCRCDACRETARVARARQREAASGDAGWSYERSVAPSEGAGVPWAALGLIALGTGGFALWHGATMRPDEDTDREAFRRTRRRWVVAGGVLVAMGVLALARVS